MMKALEIREEIEYFTPTHILTIFFFLNTHILTSDCAHTHNINQY